MNHFEKCHLLLEQSVHKKEFQQKSDETKRQWTRFCLKALKSSSGLPPHDALLHLLRHTQVGRDVMQLLREEQQGSLISLSAYSLFLTLTMS
jgi:hypothetical protein